MKQQRDLGTILIIDDEIEMLSSLKMALERGNWTVLTAKNGVEGLATLQNNKPDLALVDLNMPGMDGYTVCRHIHEVYPDLPIIILTCHSDNFHRKQAANLGVANYLIKPISMSTLRAKVEDALYHRTA